MSERVMWRLVRMGSSLFKGRKRVFACGSLQHRPRLRIDSKEKTKLPNRDYCSQFQLANCSRRASFLNLPTEVRGMASRKTKASGTCHLAKDSARKAPTSSDLALAPPFRTTTPTAP